MTPKQYFSKYWRQDAVVWDLCESIEQGQSQESSDATSSKVSGSFPPHLSATALEQGINSGHVVQVTPLRITVRDMPPAHVWKRDHGSKTCMCISIEADLPSWLQSIDAD